MPIHPNARRCSHILLNKKQCGAPAVTGEQYCRFHTEAKIRQREVPVPILQTAADIQLAITDTIRALIEGRITRLHAGTVLFGLQLAQNGLRIGNVPNIRFTGQFEDINPAERSVIIPALDDRQATEEFEAELAREEELEKQNVGAPPLSDQAAVGGSTPSSSQNFRAHATDRVGDSTRRVATATTDVSDGYDFQPAFIPLTKEEAIAQEAAIQAAFKRDPTLGILERTLRDQMKKPSDTHAPEPAEMMGTTKTG